MDVPPPPAARVAVVVREGCHLCDDAVTTIGRVCADLGVAWAVVDVEKDPALRDRYTDHVPVTLVDGRVVAYWFCAEGDLRAALAGAPG